MKLSGKISTIDKMILDVLIKFRNPNFILLRVRVKVLVLFNGIETYIYWNKLEYGNKIRCNTMWFNYITFY